VPLLPVLLSVPLLPVLLSVLLPVPLPLFSMRLFSLSFCFLD